MIDDILDRIQSEFPPGQPVWLNPSVYNRLTSGNLIHFKQIRNYSIPYWRKRQVIVDKQAPTDPSEIIYYTNEQYQRISTACRKYRGQQ